LRFHKKDAFLLIGDLHLRRENVLDMDHLQEDVRVLCKVAQPSIIVLLGDVLDTHNVIHMAPFNRLIDFVQFLATLAEEIVLLVGNHDFYANSEFQTSQHALRLFANVPHVRVVDRATTWIHHGYQITAVPYVPNGQFRTALATANEISAPHRWQDSSVLFAHQMFRGVPLGPRCCSKEGDSIDDDFPPIISGHIHHLQWYSRATAGWTRRKRKKDDDDDELPAVVYLGTPMQHTYGERGRFGMWWRDTDRSIAEMLSMHTHLRRRVPDALQMVFFESSVARKMTIVTDAVSFVRDTECLFDEQQPMIAPQYVRIRFLVSKPERKQICQSDRYRKLKTLGSFCKIEWRYVSSAKKEGISDGQQPAYTNVDRLGAPRWAPFGCTAMDSKADRDLWSPEGRTEFDHDETKTPFFEDALLRKASIADDIQAYAMSLLQLAYLDLQEQQFRKEDQCGDHQNGNSDGDGSTADG
jgi:predicted phosphodiesterase